MKGPLIVGGRHEDSGETVEIRSPWDSELIGNACIATQAQLASAIQSAVAAFQTTRRLPRWKRSQICRRVGDLVFEHRARLSELITLETGKPIQYSRGEVARATSTFHIAAEEANRVGGQVVPLDITEAAEGYAGLALRVAGGPVCAITPFNFPINLVAHKLAPAIACGNPVVLKPAPQSPLSALALGDLILEAGLPPEALSILNLGVPMAEQLVTDERFNLLTFTGSAAVGWRLKSLAGRKKVLLEMGGNAAAVVHEDADMDWALRRTVAGAYASAGQVCIKVQRLMVHRSIYRKFLDAFVDASSRVKCGDPADPETVVGPMIDDRAIERVVSCLQEAQNAGARVLVGGCPQGRIFPPTVVECADSRMRVVREEVFAPVVTVEPYDEFDEALDRVNDSVYGLQAGVFTHDVRRIAQAIDRIEAGGIIINDYPTFRVDNYPYGGVKASGSGREGVAYAIEAMTELRMVALNLRH